MSKGTIIRMVLCAVSLVFTGVCMFVAAAPWLKVMSMFVAAAAMFVAFWFNNDFTQEHREATGLARLRIKERKQKNYIGERFFENW